MEILEPNQAPSRARKIVKKGDIIYSTVRPYLMNICIIDKDITPEPIVSTGFAVFNTSLDSYNDIIAINSIPLKRSKYVSIGNGAHLGFISNGGRVTLRRVMALTTDTGIDIRNLVERGFTATTDSAKTITINNHIFNTISNIAGSVNFTYTEWIGAQLDFIIDNTIATGTNHITIALSATGLSVNGADSLVVNAGTIGKFAVIVTDPIVGDAGTAKICRVF